MRNDHRPADNKSLMARLTRTRFLTRCALLAEQATLHGWRLATWLLFFGGLWMLRIPALFGDFAAIACAAIFALGAVYFAFRDLPHLRWPNRHAIDRRIERASALTHHPLAALEDDLVNERENPFTLGLWRKNKQEAQRRLSGLKPAAPNAFMAQRDPYALRLFALLFFGLGLVMAGPQWKARIAEGLFPFTFDTQKAQTDIAVITITPPEYTKIQPIVLQGRQNQKTAAIDIPEGSHMKIRHTGGLGTPVLKVTDAKGDIARWRLEDAGDGNYFLEIPMPDGAELMLEQLFFTRAAWRYRIVPDTPPQITLREEPETLPEGAIRFPLSVKDDYGVRDISVRMTLDGLVDQPPVGAAMEELRPVASTPGKDLDINPVYDLTYHTWAGLPVIFSFEAYDDKGQSMQADPVKIILPERPFEHPAAKALIKIRKELAWAPLSDYDAHAKQILGILVQPELYQNDMIVFLSLRTMASRLIWSTPSMDTATALIDQLWDTALHIEDGNLEVAARNLNQAQRNLENTLRDPDASQNEISQAMNDLREAMAQYFSELQRELQKRMESGEPLPLLPQEMIARSINPDDLANFMDELEQRLLSGDTQSAQEMMAQLQRFMDMMQPSMSGPLPPDMQMMQQGVNELQELIDRQKDLLKQTQQQINVINNYQGFQRDFGTALEPETQLMEDWGIAEDLPPPPAMRQPDTTKPLVNTQANKTEQEALRFILGQLMLDAAEVLEEIPPSMGLAEQEMRGSSDRLGDDDPESSVPHQEQAIEYLEQAQEDLSQMLSQRIQQMTGLALGGGGMRYDPLGRPYGGQEDGNGLFPGSRVKIPNDAERKQAQEILKLLRRRSSEMNRPREELDYFQRLLRQF